MSTNPHISIEFIMERPHMTSLEIANLTDKHHYHVLEDIQALYKLLNIPPEQQPWLPYGTIPNVRSDARVANLSMHHSFTLIAGYDPVLRKDVVERTLDLIVQEFHKVSFGDVARLISELRNISMVVMDNRTGDTPLNAVFDLSDIFMSYTRFAQPMTSLEIARLTGKLHKNVLADIRDMYTALGIHHKCNESSYADGNGRQRPMYILPINLVLVLVCGYDKLEMYNVITAFLELRDGNIRGIVEAVEARLVQNGFILYTETELRAIQADAYMEAVRLLRPYGFGEPAAAEGWRNILEADDAEVDNSPAWDFGDDEVEEEDD